MSESLSFSANPLLQSPGGIYSQSSNFLDVVQSAVDPRTGQFNLAITLPTLLGNNLSGPILGLTLSFSALMSNRTNGYGLGWSLLLSQVVLNQDSAFLTLSTGENFAIDLQASDMSIGGQLVFADHKLKSFKVTRLSNESFRIDSKSGVVEILTKVAAGGSYVVHEVRSTEGRRLYLEWVSFNGVEMLQRVRDESRILFEVQKGSGRVYLVMNPESASPFKLELWLLNDVLRNVKFPEVDSLFSFSYQPVEVGADLTLLFPTDVTGPLGAHDSITWSVNSNGHQLPSGAPIKYLPRVTLWLQRTGDPAADLLHRYQWVNTRNHFGFGSGGAFRWESGRDNLYQVNVEYDYSVIETLVDTSDGDLVTIKRVWNRFHLPTLEASITGQCEVLRNTTYHVDPDLGWDDQPPYCQLPYLLSTTYRRLSEERTEDTEYRYDDYGNILYTRFPNGLVEVSEYHPASGSSDCPKDSLDMVRFLSKKTVIPAPSEHPSPTLHTTYRYEELPSLVAQEAPFTVVVEEQAWNEHDNQLLETTIQTYVRTMDARNTHYGRLETAITTINGFSAVTRYTYTQEPDRLRTRVTIEGHDFDKANPVSQSVSEDSRSLLTGLTAEETSAAGANTAYEYDALGRIIRTVLAKGSRYEASQSCAYHLDDAFTRGHSPKGVDSSVAFEETDASGRHRRCWLDGRARIVSIELEDLDNAPATFREISRTTYDSLGRASTHTSAEWDGAGNKIFELTTQTRFDDWGNATAVTSPTAVVNRNVADPVLMRSEQWQESASGTRTAKHVVYSNVAGSPIQQELYDNKDALVRTVLLTRDGLDRMVEQRVSPVGLPDVVTLYRYDNASRVIEQVLPDATRVNWTYAAHSDGEHPESVHLVKAP